MKNSVKKPTACGLRAAALLGATAALVAAPAANAVTIVENFDYGVGGGDLINYGTTGDGWDGAWTGSSGPDSSAENLSYSAPGYSNVGNDASTGSAIHGTGDAGARASRTFSTTLDGTIWVSALAQYSTTQSDTDVLLWLAGDGSSNFISIRGGDPKLRVDGSNSAADLNLATGMTHLLLARITMVEGGDDTVDFWVNPDLTGGEAGLGTATLSDSGDIGDELTGVGVSFNWPDSQLDAIRISNDPDGFLAVTAIPEPSSLALLSLGALGLVGRRRRA